MFSTLYPAVETARCLEEGIVDSPNEADMGLIMGIGFPPFHGGALKYADRMGLAELCARAELREAHSVCIFQRASMEGREADPHN